MITLRRTGPTFIFLVFVFVAAVAASEPPDLQPVPSPAHHLIALDVSGTMGKSVVDIKAYVNAYVTEYIKTGDKITVVTFTEGADVLVSRSVRSPSDRNEIVAAVNALQSAGADSYTCYGHLVEFLSDTVPRLSDPSLGNVLTILTDGKSDPSPTCKYHNNDVKILSVGKAFRKRGTSWYAIVVAPDDETARFEAFFKKLRLRKARQQSSRPNPAVEDLLHYFRGNLTAINPAIMLRYVSPPLIPVGAKRIRTVVEIENSYPLPKHLSLREAFELEGDQYDVEIPAAVILSPNTTTEVPVTIRIPAERLRPESVLSGTIKLEVLAGEPLRGSEIPVTLHVTTYWKAYGLAAVALAAFVLLTTALLIVRSVIVARRPSWIRVVGDGVGTTEAIPLTKGQTTGIGATIPVRDMDADVLSLIATGKNRLRIAPLSNQHRVVLRGEPLGGRADYSLGDPVTIEEINTGKTWDLRIETVSRPAKSISADAANSEIRADELSGEGVLF